MEMSKKLAVTYTRSAVAGRDPEDQQRRCGIFARQKGYRILYEYGDDGVNGLSLDRDGLKRLREVVKTGAIDVLLIVSLSRLAKDPQQLRTLLSEFREANISIELVK